MGALNYGGSKYPFDDRLLAHLQIVIGSKLRRNEPFFLSWSVEGGGRRSVWIDNGIPFHCEYAGARVPTIDRDWLNDLASSANATTGLTVTADNRLEASAYALAAD